MDETKEAILMLGTVFVLIIILAGVLNYSSHKIRDEAIVLCEKANGEFEQDGDFILLNDKCTIGELECTDTECLKQFLIAKEAAK